MITNEEEARAYVASLSDPSCKSRLDTLCTALIEENSRQNLISRPSEGQIWQRHVADSAQLLRFVPRETSGAWLDLGTGAGFPGLVIAAIRTDLPVFLVESRARRVEWLAHAAAQMGLANVTVLGKRLELVEPFQVSVISARAFAPLPKLLRLSSPFSTKATVYVLPKGRSAAQELSDLPKASRKMFHVEQSLTDSEAGIIVGGGAQETSR